MSSPLTIAIDEQLTLRPFQAEDAAALFTLTDAKQHTCNNSFPRLDLCARRVTA